MDEPMTIDNQIKLQKNTEAICNDLKVADISPALITRGVISPDERDDLFKERELRKQTEKLLTLLLAKDNKHFECFRVCLLEDYYWLAKGLADYEVTEKDRETYIGSILENCSLPQPPTCFVGRDKDVQMIINTFFTEGRRLAVIKAFGGQGKTALATTIGHTCVSKWGIRSVLADMKGVSFDDDIPLSLLQAIKCPPGLSSGKTNAARLIRKTCEEISLHGKKMLIILDNCESALGENTQSHFYSLLNQLLSSCNNAYILCTTRQTIQIPNEEVPLHELGTLEEDDSFVLLQSYSQHLSRKDGNHLAAECSFVALLLHILGYLLKEGRKAIDIIAELTTKTVFGLERSPLTPESLNATACINLSYKRLKQPVKDAVQILSLFPTSFNLEDALTLLNKPQSSTNYQTQVEKLTKWRCQTWLQTLCDASFLKFDTASQTYVMHSVIQAFARNQTSQENADRFKAAFLAFMEDLINHIYSVAKTEKGQEASMLFEKDRENLLVCIGFFESMQPGSKKATYNIAKKLAFNLRQIGRFYDSLRCFKLVLETVEEQQNVDTDLATLYYNIGYLQCDIGDSVVAVENLSYAIDEYEKQEDSCNYKDYCYCCYNLHLLLIKSPEKYGKCLQILKKCFDKAVAHQDLSMQYLAKGGIAEIRARRGDHEAVMPILSDILKADPDMDEKENGVGMAALNTAGVALTLIGKIFEALSLYRRAAAVAENLYGEHPETASVLNNLGTFMAETGDAVGAIDILKKAMTMRERTLGVHHEQTLTSMTRLGGAISAGGNHAEALETFQGALRIKEQVLGECLSTADTLLCLGNEMIKLGNVDEGVNDLKKALVMIEKSLGDYPLETGGMLYELANKIAGQGHYAEALRANRLALSILEKAFGDNYTKAAALNRICHTIMKLENHEALNMFQGASRVLKHVQNEDSLMAYTLHKIGQEMSEQGNADGAVDTFSRALALREKTLGEHHEETAATLHDLAYALSAQGNHRKALSTYEKAFSIMEQVLGESQSTASALHGIGHEKVELGDAAGAVDVLRRALAMRENTLGTSHYQTLATTFELLRALSIQGNADVPSTP